MPACRRTRLIRATIVLASVVLIFVLVHRYQSSRLVFRNRDVFWYVTEDYMPVSFFGEREVEGVFDYHGPPVGPPDSGPIRDKLKSLHLWPRWQPPPMEFGEIVLSDERGRVLARMPGNSGIVNGRGAHADLRTQDPDTQLYASWFFALPPGVDRSRPIQFATTFSINNLPALPVRVTIPPIPQPTSAPAQ